jgi:hypothetical protein
MTTANGLAISIGLIEVWISVLFFFHAVAHVRSFAVSILFLARDSRCVVVFEFCVRSQIFAFVAGFFLNPAAVSHQGNRSLHFAAFILFLVRDSWIRVVLWFSSFVWYPKYFLSSLDFSYTLPRLAIEGTVVSISQPSFCFLSGIRGFVLSCDFRVSFDIPNIFFRLWIFPINCRG